MCDFLQYNWYACPSISSMSGFVALLMRIVSPLSYEAFSSLKW